jgi:23S rRNA pseudouridine2605 synthase
VRLVERERESRVIREEAPPLASPARDGRRGGFRDDRSKGRSEGSRGREGERPTGSFRERRDAGARDFAADRSREGGQRGGRSFGGDRPRGGGSRRTSGNDGTGRGERSQRSDGGAGRGDRGQRKR